MSHDDEFLAGISKAQSFERKQGAAANMLQTFGAIRLCCQPIIRLAFEPAKIALVNSGDYFRCQIEDTRENLTGLPGAQKMTGHHDLRTKLVREAKGEFA